MRYVVLIIAVTLAGCSTTPEEIPADVIAIQDYVAVAELPEVDKVATDSSARMQRLDNSYFVFWVSRRQTYLIEFTRHCWELTNSRQVTADIRRDSNYLRPRRDTIRGCRIGRAFEINEAQKQEIRDLGEAPTGG